MATKEVSDQRRNVRIRAIKRDGTTLGITDLLIRGSTDTVRHDLAIEEAIRRWPKAHDYAVVKEVMVQ